MLLPLCKHDSAKALSRASAFSARVDVAAMSHSLAAIAQLGERQTEDLKVPGSIPGLGNAQVARRNVMIIVT